MNVGDTISYHGLPNAQGETIKGILLNIFQTQSSLRPTGLNYNMDILSNNGQIYSWIQIRKIKNRRIVLNEKISISKEKLQVDIDKYYFQDRQYESIENSFVIFEKLVYPW